MRDPYEVLGINKNASREEIQNAYRRLVKKYHPDQYRNNPLAKLAEEKLKEINEAYNYLMRNYSNGSGSSSRDNSQNRYQQNTDSVFGQVRSHINNGRLDMAEQVLNQSQNHTAEWFYLKGVIFSRRGWYNEALSHIQTAVNMEPGNAEYRNALNSMNFSNTAYRQRSGSRYNTADDLCSICQCLICTDCCCECMGGDFISCC